MEKNTEIKAGKKFWSRERAGALALAIVMTIALPIAIDQGYFHDNPYVLPILGLAAVLIYVVVIATAMPVRVYGRQIFGVNRKVGLGIGVTLSVFLAIGIGTGFLYALKRSKEHVSKVIISNSQRESADRGDHPPAQPSQPNSARQPLTTQPDLVTREKTAMLQKKVVPQAHSKNVVDGSDNTTVGAVPYGSIKGDRNTLVGATDSNGNTIIPAGTAIGSGANADRTSVAIGSGARAASPQQIMQNSPGGMQAGRDLTVIGELPKPARALNPEDVTKAVAVLREATKGTSPRVMFVTFPTDSAAGSEISNFTVNLENVFSQAGWNPYQERNIRVGSFSSISDRSSSKGEGIGCTINSYATPEVRWAVGRALSLLHYPCKGPAVYSDEDPQIAVFISVGTRLSPE